MGVNFANKSTTTKVVSTSAPKKAPSFLKTGSEAKALLENEEAKAELRKEQAGKLWRFFIGKKNTGDDFMVTFLDGDLTEDGTLDCPMWREHTVNWNGRWENFVAVPEEEGPDPITSYNGDKEPSFKFGLTVIDHTEIVGKDGKVFKDRRKLFVGTRKTLGVLTKLAQKNGGLAGLTVEISRSNDDAPNVGDVFSMVGKNTHEELVALFGEETATPANFAEELTYFSPEELIKMGFGKEKVIGKSGPSKDYASEL